MKEIRSHVDAASLVLVALSIVATASPYAVADARPEPVAADSVIRLATADEPGIPLTVSGTVVDAAGRPVGDAEIYAYHTDAQGFYSANGQETANPRLAGRVLTDDRGRFRWITIRPASYPDSRVTQHIHFQVTAEGHGKLSGEILFADDPLLTDNGRQRAAGGRDVVAEITSAADGSQSCEVVLTVGR